MKKVTVIINPVFNEADPPGQFFELSVIMPDKYTQLDLDRQVFERIKYTFKDEEEL